MAYSINKRNGTITIVEGQLNTETSLQLVGKDYFGYGDAIAQSFVDLLQNFASDTAPTSPIEGQIWYDTSNNFLRVYNAKDSNNPVVDTDGSWATIDLGSSGPTIIKDTTNVDHEILVLYQNGLAVAALSSEAAFTVHASDALKSSFADIKTGITLSGAANMKFHGTATTAEYADLAELYSSDKDYDAGTVVKIGGDAEVTETTFIRDEDVFGVVSTDPAYLMNSMLQGTSVPVALAGRVPCKVMGEVTKGQRLTSSDTPGVAIGAPSDATHRQVIGRALENKTTEEVGLIEIIVGVK